MKNATIGPLSIELLAKIHNYWHAANYLSVGQIYLCGNPLLKRPLTLADVKHMCVDYLTAMPAQLAFRKFPSSYRYERDELRVITIASKLDGLLADEFDRIRESSEGNVGIMARILGASETLDNLATKPRHRWRFANRLGAPPKPPMIARESQCG